MAARIARVHVFFKIFVHILEDEHEFVFGMDDVVQGNYVFVFELFHKRDFADGGTGGALFAVEVNLFQSDEFACLAVTPFEDLEEISAIGAGRLF